MKAIYADFNAVVDSGHIRLDCPGSLDDIGDAGLAIGDWTWLTDGELVVGAQILSDERRGLIGVPRWNTLVHLDDDNAKDLTNVAARLRLALKPGAGFGRDAEALIFQLLTIFETIAPPEIIAASPSGYLALRRASALNHIAESELALVEIGEALLARPDDQTVEFLYLEILRRVDLDRASIEAEFRARGPGTHAAPLAACINIKAAVAERLSDDQFAPAGREILDWVDRFDRAPGRDRVLASVLGLVRFNQGLTLLRLGQQAEARETLALAHGINPAESAIDEALQLDVYDDRARQIASRLRARPISIAA